MAELWHIFYRYSAKRTTWFRILNSNTNTLIILVSNSRYNGTHSYKYKSPPRSHFYIKFFISYTLLNGPIDSNNTINDYVLLYPVSLISHQQDRCQIGNGLLPSHNKNQRKTSNIRRTPLGNEIVDHRDVIGALPAGAAPTTSSFST